MGRFAFHSIRVPVGSQRVSMKPAATGKPEAYLFLSSPLLEDVPEWSSAVVFHQPCPLFHLFHLVLDSVFWPLITLVSTLRVNN